MSRRWVALTQAQLDEWLSCSVAELDLPVVMIDGIHFHERVILVALGIDAKGDKHVLGLREGSTESTRVVRSLLSDLVDRGLDADRCRLWVIDGGKALPEDPVMPCVHHSCNLKALALDSRECQCDVNIDKRGEVVKTPPRRSRTWNPGGRL